MISNDAGAPSSSITSPIARSPIPTLSPEPSLTLSPASTMSGNPNHRPFPHGMLRYLTLGLVMPILAYDTALRARGSLTVWFTPEAIEAWRAGPRTGRIVASVLTDKDA